MLRLVQGDVGCGKTLVAALAATHAIETGRQVALMAPTELLADQHAQNFRRWFEPLGIARRARSPAGRPARRASAVLEGIREGHAPLVIGTHALFQEGVAFASLALVIVDEQHRFGVHQRLSLREKGAQDGRQPHQLIMTATPIPRTLAMTAYADLDVSDHRRAAAGPHAGEDRGARRHAPRRSGACASAPPASRDGKPTGYVR